MAAALVSFGSDSLPPAPRATPDRGCKPLAPFAVELSAREPSGGSQVTLDLAVQPVRAMHEVRWELLSALIEEGQRNGELREVNVRYLHVAVIGLSELFINAPYVMRHLFKTRGITPRMIEEYCDFVSDLLINGIGRTARPKAARAGARAPALVSAPQR